VIRKMASRAPKSSALPKSRPHRRNRIWGLKFNHLAYGSPVFLKYQDTILNYRITERALIALAGVSWNFRRLPSCPGRPPNTESRAKPQDNRHFLDGPASGLLLFFRTSGQAPGPRGSVPFSRPWGLWRKTGKSAKRNGGQAFENKQFREMPHFAPPMISMTCEPSAKPFVSLGETESCVFAPLVAARTPPSISRDFVLARRRDGAQLCEPDDPKWRRKPLKSLKTDAEMAGPDPSQTAEAREPL
jgi:hypothetical protein